MYFSRLILVQMVIFFILKFLQVNPAEPKIPKAKVKGPIFSDEIPHLKVPKCNGSNKYFDDMIPGYSCKSFISYSQTSNSNTQNNS